VSRFSMRSSSPITSLQCGSTLGLSLYLTGQRAVTGAGRHSENELCREITTTDRHAARSHSLDNISTFGENVIGLLCAY
jgi:hypothetical protein